MRLPLLLCLALLLAPVAARAENERQWMGDTYDGGATLIYGTPESDDVPLAFSCALPSRKLTLSLSLSGDFSPRSGKVPVTLAAPPAREKLVLQGEVQFLQEMDVVVVDAPLAFDVPLARLLKQGRSLEVTVAGKVQSFPMQGVAQAMNAIEAGCAKPR